MSATSTITTPGNPTVDSQAFRDALSAVLDECARALQQTEVDPPDASPMRDLQEELAEFVSSPEPPNDVQYTAYLVDVIITDAFKNFFGDLVWSREHDLARREICEKLGRLFSQLSESLHSYDRTQQLESTEQYVATYLAIVRRLNENWKRGLMHDEGLAS